MLICRPCQTYQYNAGLLVNAWMLSNCSSSLPVASSAGLWLHWAAPRWKYRRDMNVEEGENKDLK